MLRISESATIHATADVSDATVGAFSRILQYVVINAGASIGDRCTVEALTVIGRDACVGTNVSIASGVHVAPGAVVSDHVTIGSNCSIGGDTSDGRATIIREGAQIGASVTVVAGVEIGQSAVVVDGSVVAANVPPGATVAGNPAVIRNCSGPSGQTLRLYESMSSEISGVQFLKFQQVEDVRGTLTVCQWNQQLPFVPRRVFFLHGVPNENVRGAHAHRECAQALVCFNGSVNVLLDDGLRREEFVLESSESGIVIPPGIWATQYRYSQNAMLVVFASHDYDADDYIRDYGDFLDYRRVSIDSAA